MSETITKQLVCIVDDDKTNVEILGITLGDDYEICSAYSGEQALEMIEKRMPDVVLLDIIMPDILGYDVCKRLKENPVTKNIPVIFLTGLEDQQDEEHGFEVGAVDYVTKPVSATIVRAKIQRVIENEMYIEFLERSVKSVSSQLLEMKAGREEDHGDYKACFTEKMYL